MGLSLGALRRANVRRARRWHADDDAGWTGADWSNAMCGEAGEAANVVKKLRRSETGKQGRNDPPPDVLRSMLGAELADTIIYADLLAEHYDIDLTAAVIEKFNAVSDREGFPDKIKSSAVPHVGDKVKAQTGDRIVEYRITEANVDRLVAERA